MAVCDSESEQLLFIRKVEFCSKLRSNAIFLVCLQIFHIYSASVCGLNREKISLNTLLNSRHHINRILSHISKHCRKSHHCILIKF